MYVLKTHAKNDNMDVRVGEPYNDYDNTFKYHDGYVAVHSEKALGETIFSASGKNALLLTILETTKQVYTQERLKCNQQFSLDQIIKAYKNKVTENLIGHKSFKVSLINPVE